MSTERLLSRAGLKLAGSCLLISIVGCWFAWEALTIPLGWAIRPLLAAAVVLAAGITIGTALTKQGGAR